MTKLILHAGSTKTGTSAIQVALAQNYKILKSNGILAPKGLRFEKRVSGLVSGGNANALFKFLKNSEQKPFNAKRQLKGWFREELSGFEGHTVVLSGEAIPGRLAGPQGKQLVAFLRSNFSEIKVLYYVRDIADHAASQYGEYVKRRRMKDAFHTFAESFISPFAEAVNCLDQHFGVENVEVISYPAESKDLWNKFVRRIGGNPDDTAQPRSVNRSLSFEELELIRELNQLKVPRSLIASVVSRYLGNTNSPSKNRLPVTLSDIEALEHNNREVLAQINQRLLKETQIAIASDAMVQHATSLVNKTALQANEVPIDHLKDFLRAALLEMSARHTPNSGEEDKS